MKVSWGPALVTWRFFNHGGRLRPALVTWRFFNHEGRLGSRINNVTFFLIMEVSWGPALGKTSIEKKCFLSGIARMRGGLPELKNIIYIYLFLTTEKDVQVARNWGGGVIRAMPERKHSLFQEVFPYLAIFKFRWMSNYQYHQLSTCSNLCCNLSL